MGALEEIYEIPRMEKRLASMAAIAAPCAMRVSKPAFLRHTIRVRHERRNVGLRRIVHRGLTVTHLERQNGTEGTWKAADGHPQPIDGKWVSASPSGLHPAESGLCKLIPKT